MINGFFKMVEVATMNNNVARGKVRQAKGDMKEKAGKVTKSQSQLFAPKACQSCQNPRWDKTARNT
jgi:hypothetical protein